METTLTRDAIENYAPSIQTLARTITARFRNGEEGFTIDWEGRDLSPRNAYSVGGVVRSLKFPGYTNTDAGTLSIVQWLATNYSHKAYAPIGAWLDNGTVYLDLVTILPFVNPHGPMVETATRLARNRGELAFGEFDENGEYFATHTL